MKYLTILVMLALFLSFTQAEPIKKAVIDSISVEELFDELFDDSGTLTDDYTQYYTVANNKLTQVPEFLIGLFGNERMNVEITMDTKEKEFLGVITKDNKLVSISRGTLSYPTMNIFTTESVAKEIASAKDPGQAAVDAVKSGEIDYQGVGLMPSVKTFFMKIMQGLFFFFSG